MLEFQPAVNLAGISHSLLMGGVIFELLLLYCNLFLYFKQTVLSFFKSSLFINKSHSY